MGNWMGNKPWRATAKNNGNIKWNKETENELRRAIQSAGVPKSKTKLSILLLGFTGAGKSSYINSVLGAIADRLSPHTFVGTSAQSVTKTVHSFDRVGTIILKFKLMDSPGIMENLDAKENKKYIELLLKGQISENCEITLDSDPSEEGCMVEAPCLVVVVMRANKEYADNAVLATNLQCVKEAAGKHKLKVVVVLTGADLTSVSESYPVKGENADYVYYSTAVKEAVEKASRQTGIPSSSIYPVTNYTTEQFTHTKMNVLHLFTFNELLKIAIDEANRRML